MRYSINDDERSIYSTRIYLFSDMWYISKGTNIYIWVLVSNEIIDNGAILDFNWNKVLNTDYIIKDQVLVYEYNINKSYYYMEFEIPLQNKYAGFLVLRSNVILTL